MLRTEEPRDYPAVELLTRDAFWDVYKPGCDEHYLVHILRKTDAFIRELSIVAEDGNIVGHVMLSRANIEDDAKVRHEALCLGPISVHPERQGQGIGTLLMRQAKLSAKGLGFRGILLYGNPSYYERFGFLNAEAFGITTATGQNFDEFMALELFPNSLSGIRGRFFYDKAFEIDPNEVERFDVQFPWREKHKTGTQLFE